MHPSATRPAGVVIPAGQRTNIPDEDTSNLPTLSLHNFGKLEMFAGRYVTKGGKLEQGFFIKFGGSFYLDPNGPHWFSTLKPLSKDLEQNVWRQYERMTNTTPATAAPSEDAVDVVAQEMAGPPGEAAATDSGVAVMDEMGMPQE